MKTSIVCNVTNTMNKAFNELGTEGAVQVIEAALDRLVAEDVLSSWHRNASGRGWAIYDSVTPDGIYIDWNDRGQYNEEEDES